MRPDQASAGNESRRPGTSRRRHSKECGIAGGGTGGVTVDGPDLAYWGDATLADLNLRRIGEVFNVPALGTERFESSVNGHVTASGRGTTVQGTSLVACGTVTDSSLLGSHIAGLTFETDLKDDALHVTANGTVDHVDLKAALRRPSIDGQVSGSLDAQATFANISQGVAVDRLQASGHFDLQSSKVGPVAIDRATFDGRLRRVEPRRSGCST